MADYVTIMSDYINIYLLYALCKLCQCFVNFPCILRFDYLGVHELVRT
jgi:hypothetical protein